MSDIRANTISNAAGTGPIELTKQSAAKAHGRASAGGTSVYGFNVASVVDDGTGLRTFNFTNALTSDVTFTTSPESGGPIVHSYFGMTGSYVKTLTASTGGTYSDKAVSFAVFGDLA